MLVDLPTSWPYIPIARDINRQYCKSVVCQLKITLRELLEYFGKKGSVVNKQSFKICHVLFIDLHLCLAIKCSLHLFRIAPIYVDVIVLVTNVFVVLSYRLEINVFLPYLILYYICISQLIY